MAKGESIIVVAVGAFVAIISAVALVDHDFVDPRVAPIGSVIVTSVDIIDYYLAITIVLPVLPAFPVLPLMVSKAVDPDHSGSVPLHHHAASWTAVTGIFVS